MSHLTGGGLYNWTSAGEHTVQILTYYRFRSTFFTVKNIFDIFDTVVIKYRKKKDLSSKHKVKMVADRLKI